MACDVKALYPNLNRKLVEAALTDALNCCSNFTVSGIRALTELTMHCLNNVMLEFQEGFYVQESGVVTGENNSVALANISLHFVVRKIPSINKYSLIFKRYIDDVIIITENPTHAQLIKEDLTKIFKNNQLELTFRQINTDEKGTEIEFLDVLHCTDDSSTWGFKLKNFVKPTAVNSVFLNGNSYHPLHIFRGIILSEGKRLRRLNEKDEDFQSSLTMLSEKCLRSNFPENLVTRNIDNIKHWTRSNYSISNKQKDPNNKFNKRLPWTTQFYNVFNLTPDDKSLSPNSSMTYSRPPTLGNQLLKYRNIAHGFNSKQQLTSRKCGKCGLCGNHGNLKINMVSDAEEIQSEHGKIIKINRMLNCKNFGIYAGQCRLCDAIYVGQTKNEFRVRWNNHRATWRHLARSKMTTSKNDDLNDEKALFAHYAKHHPAEIQKRDFAEMFWVHFLESPNFHQLDVAESFWISKLKASINVNKTFLPKIK